VAAAVRVRARRYNRARCWPQIVRSDPDDTSLMEGRPRPLSRSPCVVAQANNQAFRATLVLVESKPNRAPDLTANLAGWKAGRMNVRVSGFAFQSVHERVEIPCRYVLTRNR
jgi:hypothetical protein